MAKMKEGSEYHWSDYLKRINMHHHKLMPRSYMAHQTYLDSVDEQYNQFLPNAPMEVCSDGAANFSTYSIFRSSCHISIVLFPFDNQTCTLRFCSWIYDAFHLDINPHILSRDQDKLFEDHGVWSLLRIETWREVMEYDSNIHPFVYAVISISLTRRYRFYLLFILIPYFLCSFNIFLMFFIPVESGEKLSYGITAVLGLIVFQQILAFSLPPVGNESSIVGKSVTAVIGMGIISVFVEILVYNIYLEGNVYKACVYILKWYRTKTEDTPTETRKNYKSGKTQETKEEHEHYLEFADRNSCKLKTYCAVFEFCFGILGLVSLFILMF
ncbi:neuronal acetylcholine receptor subunit alpha-9-like [Anneissia japonica]|uniref:neuronal acetylcholine receptor subunit alpha-9-like n=1 Tax=Anneissia japonica TaxID=1529436 RepID=UPI0014256797|nr:neuronal acetylcholine receptor subunit alpha-9-like [Anneissia japonica]